MYIVLFHTFAHTCMGGTVVQWCSGAVVLVQWYSGTVVQWYSGTVVQWCSGTVVQH
jgi:hypothetical protein